MRNKENEKTKKKEETKCTLSRSEKKALERESEQVEEKKNTRQEKYALIQEEQADKKIFKDKEPLDPIVNPIVDNSSDEDLQVGELGKTQHFLNLTSEITAVLSDNIEENLFPKEEKKNGFNPITWIGLLIILCFGYFIYLVIQSGYDEELLLLIDSGMLLGITFIFGISIISNKKWTKIFSILNLLIILSFVGINIFLLYDWNITKEKNKKEEEIPEKVIQKSLSCKKENISINIRAKDNDIISMDRTQTFNDEEEQKAIVQLFQEQEGISTKTEENTLTVTFNFEKLDKNQYKNIMRNYLEYYRDSSDFTYVKDNHLDYKVYKETELKDFQCTEKEESL